MRRAERGSTFVRVRFLASRLRVLALDHLCTRAFAARAILCNDVASENAGSAKRRKSPQSLRRDAPAHTMPAGVARSCGFWVWACRNPDRGARTTEEFAPASSEVQPVGGIKRVARFGRRMRIHHVRPTLDFQHLLALEFHQSWMCQIKRDRNSGTPSGKNPSSDNQTFGLNVCCARSTRDRGA